MEVVLQSSVPGRNISTNALATGGHHRPSFPPPPPPPHRSEPCHKPRSGDGSGDALKTAFLKGGSKAGSWGIHYAQHRRHMQACARLHPSMDPRTHAHTHTHTYTHIHTHIPPPAHAPPTPMRMRMCAGKSTHVAKRQKDMARKASAVGSCHRLPCRSSGRHSHIYGVSVPPPPVGWGSSALLPTELHPPKKKRAHTYSPIYTHTHTHTQNPTQARLHNKHPGAANRIYQPPNLLHLGGAPARHSPACSILLIDSRRPESPVPIASIHCVALFILQPCLDITPRVSLPPSQQSGERG